MGMNVSEAKQSLRSEILSRRKSTTNAEEIFAKKLLDLCQQIGAKSVGCYLSFGTEPATGAFIEIAMASGIQIACPRTKDNGSMVFALLEDRTNTSNLGCMEPTGQEVAELDLIVVPALAVNNEGERLGRGAGYFDRYLESFKGKSVALVFDSEIIDSLPVESHDKPVDYLITPTKTRTFSKTS